MSRAVLAVTDLAKRFGDGGETVLADISVSFPQGCLVAITGVSGVGKSTFMHLLAGIDTPTRGTVSYNGRDLANFDGADRASFFGESVGLVFQSPHLLRELSVLENVMLPGLVRKEAYASCAERACTLLDAVALSEKVESKPSSLSGGQQQRVALARALFCRPAFLLADELTGNLDMQTGEAIIELLLALQQQMGMGIILSTHDTYVAGRMQECYRLAQGTLSRI